MADNVNGMYSFEEYTDMILIYGKVNKNGLAAVQEYRDTFPHRRTPDRKTFEAVERRLRETGSFKPKRIDTGRQRSARNYNNEQAIINAVELSPTTSTIKTIKQLSRMLQTYKNMKNNRICIFVTTFTIFIRPDFTKGSEIRAKSFARRNSLTKRSGHMECAAALERIQVTRISDIYELLRFLHHLKSCLGEDESIPPRVVIVDSVPPLYFPFMASDTNQGFGLLNNMMSMMKVMATEYHILFIVVNLASTFVEAEVCDNEGAEDNRDAITSDVRPMLGKYWLHAPNMRLLVSKLNSEAAQRLIRVTKSTYLQTGASCVVCVSEKGVV
ncbi:DNA repair protein rad51d [Homalodisca vitripennis]|nr:DNA repair protein rad51d [Homalodisca vitripennis]